MMSPTDDLTAAHEWRSRYDEILGRLGNEIVESSQHA